MNHPTAQTAAESLFLAMRNRWRTGGPSASMGPAQGLENAFAGSAGRRVRVRSLSESTNPTGVEIDESVTDVVESKPRLAPLPMMTGCPKCGSHKIEGWMPTDFESAKCEECGKIYEPLMAEDQTRAPGFLRIDDCLDAFNVGWKRSGIRSKQEYICSEFVRQEKNYVRMTGTMDDHSRRIIYGESLQEAFTPADGGNDYDPNSPEPRFLQMAKAELMRRRDLKCRDCGFTGLPASVDGNCPECGGLMDDPENQVTTAASTANQIRQAIRQQVLDQQKGLKDPGNPGQRQEEAFENPKNCPKCGSTSTYQRASGGPNGELRVCKSCDTTWETKPKPRSESVHASVPSHQHDIHLTDLIDHYGYKANGDHYTVKGHPETKLYVNSKGHWVHNHHGVHHEGHGHKSLAAHLQRYGNQR